jgi:molybdopterin-guanine dinucleotide biosynthesis protein A
MIAALILAGGGARRLGGVDKPLLRLGGTTILAELLARLRPQAEAVALSANGDPARFAAYDLPVLPDPVPDQGPLAGVLEGLHWAARCGAQALLTVPGDTPFIPSDLADRLSPAPACAASGGHVHPLVALWPVACRGRLQGWTGKRVRSFAEAIGMREVGFEDAGAFLNVNTPGDLAAANRMKTEAQRQGLLF